MRTRTRTQDPQSSSSDALTTDARVKSTFWWSRLMWYLACKEGRTKKSLKSSTEVEPMIARTPNGLSIRDTKRIIESKAKYINKVHGKCPEYRKDQQCRESTLSCDNERWLIQIQKHIVMYPPKSKKKKNSNFAFSSTNRIGKRPTVYPKMQFHLVC